MPRNTWKRGKIEKKQHLFLPSSGIDTIWNSGNRSNDLRCCHIIFRSTIWQNFPFCGIEQLRLCALRFWPISLSSNQFSLGFTELHFDIVSRNNVSFYYSAQKMGFPSVHQSDSLDDTTVYRHPVLAWLNTWIWWNISDVETPTISDKPSI